MLEGNPLVSIVIPMYNASVFITEMIESILSQSYTNWELIIVDDCSIDNSVSIVKAYEEKDDRIRLYIKEIGIAKGAPSSRNIGINKASGKYIIFLDADDYISIYCIEQRVSFMENNPHLDFSVFPVVAFKHKPFDVYLQFFGYGFPKDVLGSFIKRTLPFLVVSNIYKRSSIIDNELFWDIKLKSFQDSDYNMMALTKKLKYCVTNGRPDYFWRVSGNDKSVSKKINTNEHVDSHLYFFSKLVRYFEESNYKDLLILSYMLLIIFVNSKRYDAINELFSNNYFNRYPLFRYKIKRLIEFEFVINSKKPLYYFYLATPVCFLRYKFCYRSWRIWKKKYWKMLVGVDASTDIIKSTK